LCIESGINALMRLLRQSLRQSKPKKKRLLQLPDCLGCSIIRDSNNNSSDNMQISKNSVVTFHYRLTKDGGELVEDSFEGEPLTYLHGYGSLIIGMEKALEGKKKDDTFSVEIPPDEGYGERHEGLIQEVPKSAFDGVADIAAGMRFKAATDQGEVPVVVTEVTDDTVKVDGNHPLAGTTLDFTVEIKQIRKASDEEIEHGHVHGVGGHHH